MSYLSKDGDCLNQDYTDLRIYTEMTQTSLPLWEGMREGDTF